MKRLGYTQDNDWSLIAAAAVAEPHHGWRPLPSEQAELDSQVFYIGLGDRFDDDRRRIRPPS